VAALGNLLAPGDVVLVKASRAAGLERVALALTGEAAQ
jgi:UDP-N-acetylmuramyl pentapeptide synthase